MKFYHLQYNRKNPSMVNIEYIPVLLARGGTLGSAAIRLFTHSRWSHVGILTECGDYVIEALAFKGVVITPVSEFTGRYTTVYKGYAPVLDKEVAYDKAYSLVGLDYDWIAILARPFRRRWDNPDKWICSEVYAEISGMVRHDRISSFDPEDVFKITLDTAPL